MTRKAVVDLRANRPIWRVTPEAVSAIRAGFGPGWSVLEVEDETSSDGDGAGSSPSALEALPGAEVYFAYGVSREAIKTAGTSLRWVHTALAGVGGVIPALGGTDVVLTNSAGIHAEPIADWTIAAMGYLFRGFSTLVLAKDARRWSKGEFTDGSVRVREFAGTRVGIVGLGGIGRAVARRCSVLGMEVAAVRGHPDRGAPEGTRMIGGPERLVDLAAISDVLVICAPSTKSSRGFVTREVLAALPSGAYVINVGRGDLLDQGALLEFLDSGHLAGSALDVFRQEPPGKDDPLWIHPSVLVSPHVSPITDRFWEREVELILANIHAYLNGLEMRNRVDLEAGY